jgi:hypothetical protein
LLACSAGPQTNKKSKEAIAAQFLSASGAKLEKIDASSNNSCGLSGANWRIRGNGAATESRKQIRAVQNGN